MSPKSFSRKYSILLVAVIVALVFLGYVNRTFLWERITAINHILTDIEQIKVNIASLRSEQHTTQL
ncbi:MAG: hypothetical protein QNL11_06415, partial [Desulfobacterales bacterium]|nr:hypothetical protein [Desulfobacterales bacterium]